MRRLFNAIVLAIQKVVMQSNHSPSNTRRLSDLDERLLDDIGISREKARNIDQVTDRQV